MSCDCNEVSTTVAKKGQQETRSEDTNEPNETAGDVAEEASGPSAEGRLRNMERRRTH